ncbi:MULTISPECIES: hypothetical protein [unclassified Streptomyces]|uniref:hypothetical protein n=1 Tax=unclassified Streptomyces TaxID=2593676 RepID=UPI001F037A82|nr:MULTISPECIES: hypothetical protein [unclassified Streptomyces]MCH0565100.1 hypothetical protein [Streptomyces sp. MUM 2J]MCH0571186.1 hypothetical protein [Streptomyces sp. MUM 136J]
MNRLRFPGVVDVEVPVYDIGRTPSLRRADAGPADLPDRMIIRTLEQEGRGLRPLQVHTGLDPGAPARRWPGPDMDESRSAHVLPDPGQALETASAKRPSKL